MKKHTFTNRLVVGKRASPMVLGVTWYTEQEWGKVKARAEDPERFEASFQEWTTMAVDAFADLRRAGLNPLKIYVVSEELLAWCFIRQKKNNAEARAQFMAEKARAATE